jgi:putative oxidoreductase
MIRTFVIKEKNAVILLRIAVGLMLAAHGFIRLYAGTVNSFGDFLNGQGFIIGHSIAWFLTIFEIVGGISMSTGYFKKWIACFFIIQLLAGIPLVHAANGWFVVGYQSGGMEYSVLLIVCLLVIAAGDNGRR